MAYGNPHGKKKGGSWKTSTGPGGSKAPTAPVKKGPGGPYVTGPGGCEKEAVPEMKMSGGMEGVQRGGDKKPYITGPGGKAGFPINLPMHNVSIAGAVKGAYKIGESVGKAAMKHFTKGESKDMPSPALEPETGPTTSQQPVKKKQAKRPKKSFFKKKVQKTKGEGAIMRHRRQLEESLEYDK